MSCVALLKNERTHVGRAFAYARALTYFPGARLLILSAAAAGTPHDVRRTAVSLPPTDRPSGPRSLARSLAMQRAAAYTGMQ